MTKADTAKLREERIFLAGHNGLVGSALGRALNAAGCRHVITRPREQLDLCSQRQVQDLYASEAIDRVVIAAAKVGGIYANDTLPAEFIRENLAIQTNLIHGAWEAGVQNLLVLGSVCIYPRLARQPIDEAQLLDGPLEPTNEAYAVAKIAGLKMCESYNRQYGTDYRSLMPTNLYGPNDNFHPEYSHVIPALIRRFDEAVASGEKSVTVWGTGEPLRDFLYVEDLADACLHVMSLDAEEYRKKVPLRDSHVNVGSGREISIKECAETIAEVAGFKGEIQFDAAAPDGAPRRTLDTARMESLGWRPSVDFVSGVRMTYAWFKEHRASIRA